MPNWFNNIKGTLRFRFALWTASLLFVALLIFGGFAYLSLRQNMLAVVDNSLRLNASQTISLVEVEGSRLDIPNDLADITENAGLVSGESGFQLLDPDGTVRKSVFSEYVPRISEAELDEVRDKDIVFSTRSLTSGRVRTYAAPVIDEGQVIGVIYIARSLEEVDQTLQRMFITLLVSIPVLALAAGAGGYLLAAGALKPVESIIQKVQAISTDDLSARLNLPDTNDEVSRLASTFDRMLARIEAGFNRERQFTADASHELRTPLTAIQTILGVVGSRKRTAEEYEKALDDISEESGRLSGMLSNLLLLARGDSTWLEVDEQVDLSVLVTEAVDLMAAQAETKNLPIQVDAEPGVRVTGSAVGLTRVMFNLLENAIKYTGDGSITVSLATKDHAAHIAVADTGRGIPPDHLPHIFERFYRVEQARSSNGTGLGLAIVRQIIDAHEGRIEVESTPGKGTTFSVTIPRL